VLSSFTLCVLCGGMQAGMVVRLSSAYPTPCCALLHAPLHRLCVRAFTKMEALAVVAPSGLILILSLTLLTLYLLTLNPNLDL